MSEGENYARYVSQGTGGGVGGGTPPGQALVPAPSVVSGFPRTMPPIPEEGSFQGGYRQMSNVNSFQANYLNQTQGTTQTQGQTTNFVRTTTSKRRAPTISRTELNQFKVENFRPLAEQNIDLRSAKVIPLDDMSVEEAHKFQGEVRTINLQPIEVKQTFLPTKTLIDRSVQLSDKHSDRQLPEEVIFEPPINDRKPVRGEMPQEMPEPEMVRGAAPAQPQRIMVKDVIRKAPAQEVESVHQFYPDKGLDWRTCCGIFAALLFIIGMAALLKYFLFVPVVVAAPLAPVVVPAPVVPPPAPVVVAATVASANATSNNSLIHIEHTKIRKRSGGKSHGTRHVFTHDTATGKVTHAVIPDPASNATAPAVQTAAPVQMVQPLPTGPVFVSSQPAFQQMPMGMMYPNPMQMPPPMLLDSGLQTPGQIVASGPSFADGLNGQVLTLASPNSGPAFGDSGQIQSNFFGPNGSIQPLVSLDRLGPDQSFSVPGEGPLQFVSETTTIDPPSVQPVASSPPDTGRVQIEFEAVEVPDTSQVTLQSPSQHVESQKTVKVDAVGPGQTLVQSASSVRRVPSPQPKPALSIRVQPARQPAVRQTGPRPVRLVIPHTVVLPDSTVIQRAVAIRRPGRQLKTNSKVKVRRHDFDELDNTFHPVTPKTPSDLLNAVLRGENFEPYRHMADFLGFSAAPETPGPENSGITYTFKNAGDAYHSRNAKEPTSIAVGPSGPKSIIVIRSGK